ncbi:phosphatidate cytidylyltransferase [Batrachochytrium dendrobatidis]|nr:phosphatidate cytidylyltransferase [Batrachochytrium dendrobatidis]KAK5672475.1 phosphatidate cytidylyltransferase [Batrachochytrium dendrobatidis]
MKSIVNRRGLGRTTTKHDGASHTDIDQKPDDAVVTNSEVMPAVNSKQGSSFNVLLNLKENGVLLSDREDLGLLDRRSSSSSTLSASSSAGSTSNSASKSSRRKKKSPNTITTYEYTAKAAQNSRPNTPIQSSPLTLHSKFSNLEVPLQFPTNSQFNENTPAIKNLSAKPNSQQTAPPPLLKQQSSPQSISTLLADQPFTAKWKNWWVRTFWTVIMISGFISILMAGHAWVIALVTVIQTIVYREVISIGVQPSKERHLPWFRSLHWYFLGSTNYFLYGESLIHYFKPVVFVDAFLMPLANHHRFISFLLYCLGLVNFVLNLKKGNYKFQFSHFCWTHMALLLVAVQSHFIVNNIFEGLIWFVLPVSLVICNDIMAYICGFFWGRTPLIRLSPKKTWEGFIGGFIITFIFAFFISAVLASGSYMTCPMKNFQTNMNSGHTCPVNPVFVSRDMYIFPAVTGLIRWLSMPITILLPSIMPAPLVIRSFSIMPLQFHALLLACFASLIAPFGGFFASGVKRAFKIKDFGDSIPGHGGLTDRMDCQFIMGVFSFIYFQSFIGTTGVTVGTVLQSAVSYLSIADQVELHRRLTQYLAGQGVDV